MVTLAPAMPSADTEQLGCRKAAHGSGMAIAQIRFGTDIFAANYPAPFPILVACLPPLTHGQSELHTELAAKHDSVAEDVGNLRDRLDNLSDDHVLHRLEDTSRTGSLAGTGTGSRYSSSANSVTARTPRSKACWPPGCKTRACPGSCSPISRMTCTAGPRRIAATRLCAASRDLFATAANMRLTAGNLE